MSTPRLISLLFAASLLATAATAFAADGHMESMAMPATPEPLFTDRGNYHMGITTASPEAQRYFDQGMRLMFGFNLEEAERSFEKAEELDSTSAMCAWGTAFSLGPHINLPGLPDRTVKANAAVHRALRRSGSATPLEHALIDAMAMRYSDPPPSKPEDQAALDIAYARAMRDVLARYPDNADVNVLWAEAAMDVHPWDLYTPEHEAKPWTGEIVAALERALAVNPDHVGANHLYVHAVEGSKAPERALPSAKRLETLSPGEPHLVHMPAHIYHRLGMYEQSSAANRLAIVADDNYRKAMNNPQGFYIMYTAHNHQFLMWSCWMAGRYEESLKEARASEALLPGEMLRTMPGFDMLLGYTTWTYVRFGKWQQVLDEPGPPAEFTFVRGAWHAARALADASLGKLADAATERDSALALAATLPADAVEGFNPARLLASIATDLASGAIAGKKGDHAAAVQFLTHAVASEDQLRYDEPSDWYLPARHALGAELLAAGRAAEAQAVYEEDLKRIPANGWALTGLAQSLRAQHKMKEAAAADAKAREALKGSDAKIAASWF